MEQMLQGVTCVLHMQRWLTQCIDYVLVSMELAAQLISDILSVSSHAIMQGTSLAFHLLALMRILFRQIDQLAIKKRQFLLFLDLLDFSQSLHRCDLEIIGKCRVVSIVHPK